jgi:hypothetical protein
MDIKDASSSFESANDLAASLLNNDEYNTKVAPVVRLFINAFGSEPADISLIKAIKAYNVGINKGLGEADALARAGKALGLNNDLAQEAASATVQDDSFVKQLVDDPKALKAGLDIKALETITPPTFTLTASNATVDEGKTVTYTVTASSPVTADQTFTIISGGDSPDPAGSADFSLDKTSVTIAKDQTTATFSLAATPDAL